ncbi:MAG: 4Fe-4S dicluster domain-containing protein [Oscillospiraceae bacterium]
MRGVHTFVTEIRRRVFTEIARLAYEGGDYSRISDLPYKIIPGEIAEHRENVFVERAIVGERLRLAIGLPLRSMSEHKSVSEGIDDSAIASKYFDPPLVNIIPFACNACPPKQVRVTDSCQGCIAHPCIEVCPKNAISTIKGKSVIDETKCVKCGKCIEQCAYNAIIRIERPCAAACGMDAIESDHLGRAKINYDKCVSCGMCLVNCPFAAIADKSQIFQLIHAIKEGTEIIAAVAPAFVGQFGREATPYRLKEAMKILGISTVVEVAVGADLCTVDEAKDFLEKVPAEQPFMGTSCCPAWSVMAKKLYPDFAPYISMALTPMVLTARLIKKSRPNAKVVFIGPCAAKKLEASRSSVRSDVDFVLTFEELQGMFDAKDIYFSQLPDDEKFDFQEGTSDGRGFAVSGGVANAVASAIKQLDPERELLVDYADGLRECRKMLALAKVGKRNGYLLEGMGCPGGCVAGAGTIQSVDKSTKNIMNYKQTAEKKESLSSKYIDRLPEVMK